MLEFKRHKQPSSRFLSVSVATAIYNIACSEDGMGPDQRLVMRREGSWRFPRDAAFGDIQRRLGILYCGLTTMDYDSSGYGQQKKEKRIVFGIPFYMTRSECSLSYRFLFCCIRKKKKKKKEPFAKAMQSRSHDIIQSQTWYSKLYEAKRSLCSQRLVACRGDVLYRLYANGCREESIRRQLSLCLCPGLVQSQQ